MNLFVGMAILVPFVLFAIAPSTFATHPPIKSSIADVFEPPSAGHWLGTDELGRDVYSRVVYGARRSLLATLVTISCACLIGVVLGVVAGYWGGWTDRIVMIAVDMVLAFPTIVLAMAVGTALGPSLSSAVLALVAVWWPLYARLTRGLTLQLKQQEYVAASRALGAGPWHIILKHILPNSLSSLLVRFSLDLGFAVLTLASLGFIGIGVSAPTPEWGAMVNWGRTYFLTEWWIAGFPALSITLVVVGAMFVGDALNDLLDPMS